VGQYQSRFKGSGLNFTELREYSPGDDIRRIDWKASARSQRVYVKSYEEERCLNILTCLDISSSFLHCLTPLYHQYAIECLATLAYLARASNDEFGILLFSDEVHTILSPASSRVHWNRATKLLLSLHNFNNRLLQEPKQTDLKCISKTVSQILKHPSILYLVSDFIFKDKTSISNTLKSLRGRHKVICVHICPQIDHWLPKTGLTRIVDAEDGRERIIDCSSTKIRSFLSNQQAQDNKLVAELCKKNGASYIQITTDVAKAISNFLCNTQNL
jgi:uncharacterized protein (DUF58 family)